MLQASPVRHLAFENRNYKRHVRFKPGFIGRARLIRIQETIGRIAYVLDLYIFILSG